MTGQKQHVEINRKVAIRRRMLDQLPPGDGIAWVPFCGDGDLTELTDSYGGRRCVLIDNDPKRTSTATARHPQHEVITADADTAVPTRGPIAVIDADSYAYPYDAIRAAWRADLLAGRVVVFGTDKQIRPIVAGQSFRWPDGRKGVASTTHERRSIANRWHAAIHEWLTILDPDWIVADWFHARRQQTIYWGALMERRGVDAVDADGEMDDVASEDDDADGPGGSSLVPRLFTSRRKDKYLGLLEHGWGRSAAAQKCGVSRATVWRHMCDDPEFAVAVEEAEERACDAVETAMWEAATAGHVTAQQVWLYNRRPDRWRDRRNVAVTGADGGPVQVQAVPPEEILSARLEDIRTRLAELGNGENEVNNDP